MQLGSAKSQKKESRKPPPAAGHTMFLAFCCAGLVILLIGSSMIASATSQSEVPDADNSKRTVEYCAKDSILLAECSLIPLSEGNMQQKSSSRWLDWWWTGPGLTTQAFVAETQTFGKGQQAPWSLWPMPRQAVVGPTLLPSGSAYVNSRRLSDKVRVCASIEDKHGKSAARFLKISALAGPAHATSSTNQRILADVETLRRSAIRLCTALRLKSTAAPLEAIAAKTTTEEAANMQTDDAAHHSRGSAARRLQHASRKASMKHVLPSGGGRYLSQEELELGWSSNVAALHALNGANSPARHLQGTLSPNGPVIQLRLLQAEHVGEAAPKLGQPKPPAYFCPHRQIRRIRKAGILAIPADSAPPGEKENKGAAASSQRAMDAVARRLGLPALGTLADPEAWVPPVPGAFALAAPPLSSCVPLPQAGTNDSYTVDAADTPHGADHSPGDEPLLTVGSTTVFGLMRGLETVLQLSVPERQQMWVRSGHPANSTSVYRGWQPAGLTSPAAEQWASESGDLLPMMSPLLLPSGNITVRDSPFLSWRGMLLDTARHFAPTEAVARAIQGLSWTKANVLHWHPVDAQAFAIELPGAIEYSPSDSRGTQQRRLLSDLAAKGAWSGRQVHTAGEVTALVLWAAEHGVRIVPEIDVPGHTASWSLGFNGSVARCPQLLDRYIQSRERSPLKALDVPGLRFSEESSLVLAAGVMRATGLLFPDEWMHWGGDEVDSSCFDEDSSMREMRRREGKSWDQLGTKFYHDLMDTLAQSSQKIPDPVDAPAPENGFGVNDGSLPVTQRRIMLWQDSFDPTPEGRSGQNSNEQDNLPKGFGVQPWKCWGGQDTRATMTALRAGRTAVQSACLYLDWGWTWDEFLKQDVTKGMIGRRALAGGRKKAPRGIWELFQGGQENHARRMDAPAPPVGLAGGEGAAWAEQMDASNIDCKLWPRMASIQERLWSGPGATAGATVPVDPDSDGVALDPELQPWLDTAKQQNSHITLVDDAAGTASVRLQLSTSAGAELDNLGDSWSRYAAWRDLSAVRGLPASPLNNQWAKPSLGSRSEGRDLFTRGKDPSAAEDGPSNSLAATSSLRQVSTSTGGTSDYARGQCSGVDQANVRDPPARRGRPFRVLLYNVDNGGSDTAHDARGRSDQRSDTAHDARGRSDQRSDTAHDARGRSDQSSAGETPAWLQLLTSQAVRSANPIPRTRSENSTLGRPSDWFAFRSPKAPGDLGTAAKEAKAELGGRLGEVLAFVRGREADAVAIVEAVGWGRRANKAGGRRASSHRVPRVLQVAEPDGLRYRAKAAGFPFAERLSTPSGFNVALMSRTPIRALGTEGGADATHFERGVLAADLGDVIVAVAHLHAHDSHLRIDEATRLARLVRRLETDHRKPVLVAGDMNSLSPLDRECHDRTQLENFFQRQSRCDECAVPEVPYRLEQKYLRLQGDGSHSGIEYQPLALLGGSDPPSCQEGGGAAGGGPLVDLLAFHDGLSAAQVPSLGVQGSRGTEMFPRRCLGTQPTGLSMLGQVPPEEVLPFRLDYVYGSQALAGAACDAVAGAAAIAGTEGVGGEASGLPVACRVLADSKTFGLSDHFPVECDLSWDAIWGARERMMAERGAVSARARKYGVAGAALDAMDRGWGARPAGHSAAGRVRRLGAEVDASGDVYWGEGMLPAAVGGAA